MLKARRNPKPRPAKPWLDVVSTLSPKAKRTLSPEGAAQHEHDLRAVAHMRRLLQARRAQGVSGPAMWMHYR